MVNGRMRPASVMEKKERKKESEPDDVMTCLECCRNGKECNPCMSRLKQSAWHTGIVSSYISFQIRKGNKTYIM